MLPLSIRVADAAAGNVTLSTDSPGQRGPADTTFTFNVTIHNDTAAEIAFTMDATGPAGLDRDGQAVRRGPGDQRQRQAEQHGRDGGHRDAGVDVTAGDFPLKRASTAAASRRRSTSA